MAVDLFTLLRTQSRDLVVRLAVNPIPAQPDLAAITEANWPSYLPARNLTWEIVPQHQTPNEVFMTAAMGFARRGGQEPASAAAAFVTYEPAGQSPQLLSFTNFRAPLVMNPPFSTAHYNATLQAALIDVGPPPQYALVTTETITQWDGDTPLYKLAGQDKSLLATLHGSLVAALERDSVLPDLTRRSTKSRLPLVPPGDVELARAVTLLRARLQTMLAS